MFALIVTVYQCAMDNHSKREVLKIFTMNEKNVIARFLFLNSSLISQKFKIF